MRRPLLVVPLAFIALVVSMARSGEADAALHNPIPADASGDPTFEFFDNQSLWAYMTSDVQGGRICVVPEEGDLSSLSCDGPAKGMGLSTTIAASIGTVYTLVKREPLKPGTYRLLVEDSDQTPLETSQPFTVSTCVDCDPHPDAAIVQAFKAAAAENSARMGGVCAMQGLLEKVAGKATGMRGWSKSIKVPVLDYSTNQGVFVATPGNGFTTFTFYDPLTADINIALDILKQVSCGAKQMYHDQALDPPDPNFETIAQPVFANIPQLSPALLDVATRSVDRERALGEAVVHAFERYQGANAAGNAEWQIAQLRAAGDNASDLSLELIRSAQALRAWAGEAAGDPELAGVVLSSADVPGLSALYLRVRDNGFTDNEISQLHALGYSDSDIDAIRTHASADLDQIPLDTTYPDALQTVADDLESQAGAVADFASEVYADAGRLEASTPANHAPVAVDDTLTTAQDTAGMVNVLANDSDPDNDAFAVTGSTDGAHGTVSCELNGLCFYTPASGYTGTDAFTYTISDGLGGTATGNVAVTVTSNQPPSAVGDSMRTLQDRTGKLSVLANDSDPDGQLVNLVSSTQAAHGTVNCSSTGACSYVPASGYIGPDLFTYTISDGHGGTATATVNVTVLAIPLHTQTEINEAVIRGVQYLDSTQNADGSFGFSYPVAETALAIVAYGVLDRGDINNLDPTLQDHLRKAVSWLLAQQDQATGAWQGYATYYTGLSLEALAFSTGVDPAIPAAIANGRAYLLSTQNAPPLITGNPFSPDCSTDDHSGSDYYCGGWNYDAGFGRSDESNTGFALTGLALTGGVPPAAAAINVGWQRHVQEWKATNYYADRNDGGGCYQPGFFCSGANDTGSLVFGYGYDGAAASDPNVHAAIVFGRDVLDEYQLTKPDGVRYSVTHTGNEENGTCVIGTADCDWANLYDGGYHYSLWALTKGLGQFIAPDLSDPANWYPEVVDLLLSEQGNDGSWPQDGRDDATTIAATSFAVSALRLVGVPHTLTVTTNGTGSGTVTSTPAGIDCGSDCTETFADGTPVTLTAKAAAGSTFAGWSGGCSADPCSVIMNDDKSVTATFNLVSENTPPVASDVSVTTPEDVAKEVTLAASDADGDPLTYTIVAAPAHGTLGPVVGNKVTYTPAAGFFGPDSFTFKANDGSVDSNTATVSITVDHVNHAPVAEDGTLTTDEDTGKDVTLHASDPDGDPLSYAIVTGPTHGTLSGSGATRTYTPNANYNGPDSFTFKANDGTLDSNVATVTITVRAANLAPVAVDDSLETATDVPGQSDVLANDSDPDGDPLSVANYTQAAHAVVACTAAGLCSYTPEAGYSGGDSFTYTVSDSHGGTAVGTVSVTVRELSGGRLFIGTDTEEFDGVVPPDRLGVADVDGGTVKHVGIFETTFPMNGLEISRKGTLFSGDPLSSTLREISFRGELLSSITGPFADGCCKEDIASDGTYIWRPHWPSALIQYLPDGTLVNSYAQGDVVGATFVGGTLWITKWSSRQVGTFDPATNTFTPKFNTDANAGGLAYDPKHNLLWVGLSGGVVEAWDLATLTLVPGSEFKPFGDIGDTIDGLAFTAAHNAAPHANDSAVTTDEGTPVQIDLSADDPDGDPLTFSIVAPPQHGHLGTVSGNKVTYTPDNGYRGPDAFTFKASDGTLNSNVATESITVRGVNHAPVAQDGSLTTDQDVAKDVTLQTSDPDGDALTFSIVSQPQHGTLSGLAPALTYTPSPGYSGPDAFTFKANDGSLDSNVATVSITVNHVNHAPVAQDGTLTTDEDTAKEVTLQASDPDGDPLSYAIVSGPTHGSLSGSGATRSYTPSPNYNGPDSFTFKANDGSIDSNTAAVSITVRAVNDAPTMRLSASSTGAQYSDPISPVTVTITDIDSPPGGLSVQIDAPGLPNNVAFSTPTLDSAAGTATFTVSGRLAVAAGSYPVTLRGSDGSAQTVAQTLTINVSKETAVITAFSPEAITVDGSDGDVDALTETMTVTEDADGNLSSALGGAGLAAAKPIALQLAPAFSGTSYSCTATNTGYPFTGAIDATASCTMADVAVNVYQAAATIGANPYFTGSGSGVVTVTNPALGFTTGGGHFAMTDGTRVNFGFNAKTLKSGQPQGSLLVIFHRRDGNWMLKSNAFSTLQQAKDPTGFWSATMNGKATLAAPVTLRCGSTKCGNYSFNVYVEDRAEPGAGKDRVWIEVRDPSGAIVTSLSLPAPGSVNTITLGGGNIQVPQPQALAALLNLSSFGARDGSDVLAIRASPWT